MVKQNLLHKYLKVKTSPLHPTAATGWWNRWRRFELLHLQQNGGTHLPRVGALLRNCHPNKPHSLSRSAPNPLVERLVRVCLRNFPSRDRLESLLCSRGCLPGWDTPCLPDLICHTASEYVKVLQLWAVTRWWSSGESWAGEPSQFQHIPIREEPPCLHPQRDLSATTGRVEWANPQLSKLTGKSHWLIYFGHFDDPWATTVAVNAAVPAV